MLELRGRILLAGDWHGSFPQAEKAIRFARQEEIGTIIQLGDFGIWSTDKPYLNRMQALLREWDIQMYFIDGNHEDFVRLYQKRVLDNGTRYVRDNISHLPRGYRIHWEGLNILCLGGAASIDRLSRRKGKSWWPEEYITDADVENAVAGGKADIMLCHDSPATAPNGVTDDLYQQTEARKYFGTDIVDECTEHRRQLQKATDKVTPSLLFHGHYHMYMASRFRHADADQSPAYVWGLDQGTGSIGRSTMILEGDEIKNIIAALDSVESSDIVRG